MARSQIIYQDVLESTHDLDIAVASTATVYSRAIELGHEVSFALWYQATSSGNVAVQIDYEVSHTAPATEGAADSNFVIPDGVSAVVDQVTTETVHHIALSPVLAKYIRFKLTGEGANDATTTMRLKLCRMEEI